MVQQRLPAVNSDDGIWGDILRQYLMKEHYNDALVNSFNKAVLFALTLMLRYT